MKPLMAAAFIFMAFALLVQNASVADAGAGQVVNKKGLVFSTWEGFEGDKCASIWLIKRFIDRGAVIKFFPKGEVIQEGIPFDIPDAKFRRYHNISTFESLLKHYKLHDPRLVFIGKIIHDMEVNIWEKKLYPETKRVMDEINSIIFNSKKAGEIIEKSNQFFDRFYRRISLNKSRL